MSAVAQRLPIHDSSLMAPMKRISSLVAAVFAVATFSVALAWQIPKEESPADSILHVLGQQKAKYWKGNLHTHSLWSDGNDFPEMIADWYKRHHYNFLVLSDHNVLSEGRRWVDAARNEIALRKYRRRFGKLWVETRQEKGREQIRLKPLIEFRSLLEAPGQFLMVQGEEITHRFARNPVHLNGVNLRDVIQPIDGDSVAETIRVNARAVGVQSQQTGRSMLAFLNHPNFGWGVRAEDMIPVEELRFFEIYNGHPGVANYGDDAHPGCERMWDIVLALRLGKYSLPIIYGLATDDAHRYHEYGVGKVNPGRGWVMVKAPHLTAETILQSMHRGNFYSSTGVLLKDIRTTDKTLTLRIDAKPGVTYKTQFIVTTRDAPLTAKPNTDKKGKPRPITKIYSKEIGKIVQESTSLSPTYRFTGKELYVRAKIVSDKKHPNPFKDGDVEVAWTQPATPQR